MLKPLCEEYIELSQKILAMAPHIEAVGEEIRKCIKRGNKILTAGNGGSACDALHLSEELMGRFNKSRDPIPSICLSSDPALLTCIANDYGFDNIYSRQLIGLAQQGDCFISFSTSGNSPNIVAAFAIARSLSVKTIALLGKGGGQSKGLADYEIIIPSNNSARIQEVHTFILHAWLHQIESIE